MSRFGTHKLFQNKRLPVSQMACWAPKVIGTFEKLAPDPKDIDADDDDTSFDDFDDCLYE